MKILITGGHHTSSIPIIKELQNKHKDAKITFIGHKYNLKGNKNTTLEYRDITSMNIPFYNLTTGKFYKKVNLVNITKIIFGFFQSFILLLKIKPDIVLSFGGYLSVPVVIVAYFLRIKILVHEQTLVLGLANKIGSKFASKIFISWPQSQKYFNKDKTILTGIPIRPEIFKNTTNNFKINSKLKTIYITGGKSGSNIINKTILKILSNLLEKYNVIHQCGDNSATNDYTILNKEKTKLKNTKGVYHLVKFVDTKEIGEVFDKSDIVVSRSGAHTISELLILEKPSILIPISWSSHNEQYENAKLLKDNNLAEIINEKELNSNILASKIDYVLNNYKKYVLKDKKIKSFLQKDSTKIIIDEIYKTYKS